MGRISDFISEAKNLIVSAFAKGDFLELRQRQQFKEEAIEATRSRLQLLTAAVLFLQIVNVIGLCIFDLHKGFEKSLCIGSFFLLFASIACSLALEYLRRNAATVGYRTKSFAVHTTGCLLILGNLLFIYGDFSRNQSSISYILLLLAISAIPTLNSKELLLYILPITAITVIIGITNGVTFYILAQSVMVSLVCLYAAQMRYSNAVKAYKEKQRLSATNIELERLSETDQLTNILNRRGLERHVKNLAASHRRSGENICMLMVDIDLFKQYNDKYYHFEGDRCLSMVAECLKNNAKRSTDIVARYGGEEFVVVCLDMKASDLVSFALKLKSAVENMKIGLDCSSSGVTISIGAAMIEMDDSSLSDEACMTQLFEMSDHELYNAKANGRNCVSYRGHIHR
jgi:diguanylate cyclase (GGDEF)-like protein